MKFLRTFFISFVFFGGAAVYYLPSSMMVDYTEREERLREKSFCMFPHYITPAPPQREVKRNFNNNI
jgi:hypothetical protein